MLARERGVLFRPLEGGSTQVVCPPLVTTRDQVAGDGRRPPREPRPLRLEGPVAQSGGVRALYAAAGSTGHEVHGR